MSNKGTMAQPPKCDEFKKNRSFEAYPKTG